MKAVVCSGYGSPDVIQVKEVDKPSPKANQVLVKVHVTSITTADSLMRAGTPRIGRLFLGLTKHKNPIAGTGFSGEVEEIGNEVTQFKIGDSVFGETGVDFSANAEYICIAEDAVIVKSFANVSHQEAAPICDGAVTSYAFLKDIGQLKSGQRVLVNGASGSLGVAAIQIAKAMGAEVTGVCSGANVDLVKSLGADKVINYQEEDFTKRDSQYDLVYDSVAKSTFGKCKSILTEQGAYLSPGLDCSLLFDMVLTAKFSSKKAKFSATGLRPATELRAFIDELKPLFESGKIRTVIDKTYKMSEAADAHRYIDTGRKKGSVVVNIVN